jgi:hypothetical protein
MHRFALFILFSIFDNFIQQLFSLLRRNDTGDLYTYVCQKVDSLQKQLDQLQKQQNISDEEVCKTIDFDLVLLILNVACRLYRLEDF